MSAFEITPFALVIELVSRKKAVLSNVFDIRLKALQLNFLLLNYLNFCLM